MNVVKNT